MLLRHKQMMSSLRLSKNNKGVTLIELIAVIAVLGVVSAAVAGFMITGSKMSAKVSGDAGDSMKQQTTVEFINKTILRCSSSDLRLETIDDEELKSVRIKLSDKSNALLTTENNTVIYELYTVDEENNAQLINTIELCSGTINFVSLENDTLTYKLDDEKHVVHLRVVAQSGADMALEE